MKGDKAEINARQYPVIPECSRRGWIAISLTSLLLSACATWPDINKDCESYGVLEKGHSMGSIVRIDPLYHEQLSQVCADVDLADAAIGSEVRGCVFQRQNGVVRAYYAAGDRCAMNHELCHAIHGSGHTEHYLQQLRDGKPMPYCPQNQWSLKLTSR